MIIARWTLAGTQGLKNCICQVYGFYVKTMIQGNVQFPRENKFVEPCFGAGAPVIFYLVRRKMPRNKFALFQQIYNTSYKYPTNLP